MFAHALKEFPRESADDVLLPVHIGPAESAGEHAAHVPPGLEQSDPHALLGGCNRGHRAAGSRAVNDDIESLRRLRATHGYHQQHHSVSHGAFQYKDALPTNGRGCHKMLRGCWFGLELRV